jgi:hypothetical protein
MWQQTQFQLNGSVTDTGFNAELKTSIDSVLLPTDVTTQNAKVSAAESDSSRRIELVRFADSLEQVVIDPWCFGQSAQTRQHGNFWLSPTDAQSRLKSNLERTPWSAAICFMVTGTDIKSFSDMLLNLVQAFPNPMLRRVYRHAAALSTHDNDKLFIQAERINQETPFKLEQLDAYINHKVAKQNVAIAEAFASDKSCVTLLENFKDRRSIRLSTIKGTLDTLDNPSDSFGHVLYLEGTYLGEELAAHTPKNENAPLCCVFAIGGTTTAVAPLKQALSL